MDPLGWNTDEATAMKFADELNDAAGDGKPKDGIARVLDRIKGQVVWTAALSRTEGGEALELAILTCSTSPERRDDDDLKALLMAVLDVMHSQVREDDIREFEARWWGTAPLPEDAERITLEFRDVTREHKSYTVKEDWPPETVECAPSEPFENAAQRFRVQANKKHRHPFRPSRYFDAVLRTEQTSLYMLGTRTVADVMRDLSEECVVPYVRNDEDNHSVSFESPTQHFELWDITLPEWCVMPDHWVEPTPPPGFVEHPATPPALNEQYYKKVPTLHMSGSGRRIVPSAKKPEIITRSVFIPVENSTPTATYPTHLYHEADLVPDGAHLTSGKISLEDALKRRKIMDQGLGRGKRENKFVTQRLGIAWGLEVDKGGQPAWLHCVDYGSDGLGEYVLNLTRGDRRYEDSEDGSPLAMRQIQCAWVGVVPLPADRRAVGGAKESKAESASDKGASSTSASQKRLSFDDWHERTTKWIRDLNKKEFAPVVEVGADGTFVAGDLEQSKGEDDEFEAEVTGAKPGVWLMSVDPAETEDGDADEDELMGGDALKVIRFVWKSDGSVNYGALPRATTVRTAAADAEGSAEWEVVENFSVDSGMVCLFSKHALDQLLSTGTDRQAMLETLEDARVEDHSNVFVPAGVVIAGDDGGYEVEGRRDAEGRIVALRLRVHSAN